MHVGIRNQQKALKVCPSAVRSLVRVILNRYGVLADAVHVCFVSTKRICQLHAQYFNDPSTTDCITFPLGKPPEGVPYILGDVFVCPQTACDYAERRGLDPYRELSLYIVHGLLHLIGFDDIDPKERLAMRRAERDCLLILESRGLLLRAPLESKPQDCD